MNLVLNIYKDDELKEIARVVEADKLKIPYRVAIYLISSLENIDIDSQSDLLHFVGGNVDKLDKIIKATFGVSENELECIDTAELGAVAMELYKWGLDKIKSVKGNNPKNA